MDEIENLQAQATDLIHKGDLPLAISFLNKSIDSINSLSDSPEKFRLLFISYNLLGHYYKKGNRLDKALSTLLKACELEGEMCEDIHSVANVHLNIASILSFNNEHERALRHALKSVKILENNFVKNFQTIKTLVVAYRMLGLEYETLDMKKEAVDCYRKGFNLGKDELGDDFIVRTLDHRIKDLSPVKLPHVRKVFTKFTPKVSSTKHMQTKKLFRDFSAGKDWNNPELTTEISFDKKLSAAKLRLAKAKRGLQRLIKTRDKLKYI